MLKAIPYSVLTQGERAYEIMLLRDQHGNTFTDIAKVFQISVSRVTQQYNNLKVKQIHLYINHIAVALGYESTSQVRNVYENAYECYQDRTYACAKYKDILMEYRVHSACIDILENPDLTKPPNIEIALNTRQGVNSTPQNKTA